MGETSSTHDDYAIRATLKKWPSLSGKRISAKDGARPYTLVEASLYDCIRRLLSKPESQRHLYEIQTADGRLVSAREAMEMAARMEK